MKTSGTLTRGKVGHRPARTSGRDLFVLVIDREKMVKQLLEAVSTLGPPHKREN